jgi:hypothetical protein
MTEQDNRWIEIAEPRDPRLVGLRGNWQLWQSDGAIPPTHRFDPQHDSELLPWTMLVDIEARPNPYRAFDLTSRFIGSSVAHYFGAEDRQRVSVSEIGDPFAERWFEVADRVVAARSCCCFQGAPYDTGYAFTHFEMLILPFTTDEVTIDSLLAAFAMSMVGRAARQ